MLSSLVHITAEVSNRLFFDISELPPALTGNDLSLPPLPSISFSCGSLLCSCEMFVSVAGVVSVTASTVAAAVVPLSRDFSFWSKVDVRLTSRSLPMDYNRESYYLNHKMKKQTSCTSHVIHAKYATSSLHMRGYFKLLENSAGKLNHSLILPYRYLN
jgi:hypothetical protein